jgi:hypothetical protein
VVYYCQGSESYTEASTSYHQTNYYKGFVVPAPEYKFGKGYYIRYEYPLKNVLPLAGTYATDYKLIQEEGETSNSTWIDMNGDSQNWSWTNYTFYLNKNSRDLDGDGTIDAEDPIRFDASFDIKLISFTSTCITEQNRPGPGKSKILLFSAKQNRAACLFGQPTPR